MRIVCIDAARDASEERACASEVNVWYFDRTEDARAGEAVDAIPAGR